LSARAMQGARGGRAKNALGIARKQIARASLSFELIRSRKTAPRQSDRIASAISPNPSSDGPPGTARPRRQRPGWSSKAPAGRRVRRVRAAFAQRRAPSRTFNAEPERERGGLSRAQCAHISAMTFRYPDVDCLARNARTDLATRRTSLTSVVRSSRTAEMQYGRKRRRSGN
jgi:hypothetical protein